RNRISSITYSDTYSSNDTIYQSASHFSYDIHGNVKKLHQEIKELSYLSGGLFSLDYEYDLISGNVNKVYYQKGKPEQFTHRYRYDADNRLTHVYTSDYVGDYNQITERIDARYFYLPHGPLARVELGKKSIQGLDYAYTLQGWLKNINGYRVDINSTGVYDIGEDGSNTNYVNKRFGRDLFSSMIQFYQTDYSPISGNNYFNLVSTNSIDLYNGNISAISVGIKDLNPLLKSYRYDKINRIKEMKSAGLNNNIWGTLSNLFGSTYSYDFNGNIDTLIRYDQNGNLLHNIRYTYSADRNRLSSIIVSGTGIGSSSYQYDALGNLIRDNNENINVTWNVIGKVKSVQTPNNMLNFAYNPFGQRQIKRTTSDSTYYIHDATGNVMSIYVKDYPKIVAKERPIYGSSRLGIMNKEVEFNLTGIFLSKSNSTIGIKEYELSDHLGNVSVVVLDRKNSLSTNIQPIIISNTDYYPFGYPISYRTHSSGYRYGFNGQEGDGEIYGDNLNYAFTYRMYDSRIGRFWSVDPLRFEYPWNSTYAFAENSPIAFLELEGLEKQNSNIKKNIYVIIKSTEEINESYYNTSEIVMGTFKIIVANSIMEASEKIINYMGDNTIDNIIFDMHGSVYENDIKRGLLVRPNDNENINTESIGNFVFHKERNTQAQNDDVQAIQNIFKKIKENGNVVLLSCQVGDDLNLIRTLSYISDYKLNIYANKDDSPSLVYDGKVQLWTGKTPLSTVDLKIKIDEGWIKASGNPTQIIQLKNEQNLKGSIYIDSKSNDGFNLSK
ncbi:MAG: RHS repeat-associated core domain-containing protein, partial [Bacteroidales bacterium]|nr:RHS repeat-associated core domain-containing protein [Bacteroidales bacterium]